MIIIVCALEAEAAPIIRSFNLRKVIDAKRFPLFRGEDMALIISGIGKVRSALATSHAITALGHSFAGSFEFTFNFLNIGIAGSRQLPEGNIFEISKVTDRGTGKDYFPDLLFTQKLPRISLETFDAPVSSPSTEFEADCVDMEGSGFCEAASTYVAPSQFALLKVISDRCEGENFTREKISLFIEQKLPDLAHFIAQGLSLAHSRRSLFSQDEMALFERIEANLKLSFTERITLRKAVRGAAVRAGKIPEVGRFGEVAIASPFERKALFSELLSLLHQGPAL